MSWGHKIHDGELPDGVTKEEIDAAMAEADTIFLTIEEHDDWLYAWDRDNNRFLAQGSTIKDLFERLYELAHTLSDSHVMFRIEKQDGGEILKRRSLTELQ